MPPEAIWAAHADGAEPARLRALAHTAEDHFYLAMLRSRAGELADAAELAAQASRSDPDRVVYAETARCLRRAASGDQADVYAGPEAFTAFARGGGNVKLYQAVHEALRGLYTEHRPRRLLDIGAGEGHGLLAALTPDVKHVDLVEPSVERGERAAAGLADRAVPHQVYPMTAQRFAELEDVGPWDLAQETFALITLSREDRQRLFEWLRPRVTRLALVEFDVPDSGTGLRPTWFRYVVERYERGIREYDQDRELVAQGFLAPVLLGVLGGVGGHRHHEQPVARWQEDLASAGFHPEPARRLCDYWWGPAFLVSAT